MMMKPTDFYTWQGKIHDDENDVISSTSVLYDYDAAQIGGVLFDTIAYAIRKVRVSIIWIWLTDQYMQESSLFSIYREG